MTPESFIISLSLCPGGDADLPHPDLAVAVAGKECLAISRPGHGEALGWLSLGVLGDHVRLKLINHVLALKILKETKN